MRSLISAFAMYSRIPMPPIEWKEENRRYALCFFPLIGAVIGAVMLGWQWLCNVLGAGDMLFAVGCTVIPIAITGGIHLDGFCDVSDAKASCAEKEKALEIMKDSRVGAFAVIDLAIYLLIQTALFTELRNTSAMLCAALVFVLSRSLSGLAAVTLKCAKKTGTLQDFSLPAHKKITVTVLSCTAVLSAVLMALASPAVGISAAVGGTLSFAYYRSFSYKRFGGITGDLEGWFLQICELTSLAFITAAVKLIAFLT